MSTQTLVEGSRLLALLLIDTLQIHNVGDPVTVGYQVTRTTTPVGDPVPGLVQSVTLENAVESRTTQTYAIKVPVGTALEAGQAIEVLACAAEPSLVGQKLLVDKMSANGLAMLRKGTGTTFAVINQEGKEVLS